MRTAGSWLREWELLQQLMQPLVETARVRRPQAWAVGPAEDAVALALAFHHAWGDPATADIVVYLSEGGERPGELSFRLSDMKCVPVNRLDAAFLHRDHHWVPRERVTRRVVLQRPSEPVDLVTVRVRRGDGHACEAARPALDSVRREGRVLFDSVPPDGLVDDGCFRPVDGSGRLFERIAEPAVPQPGDADSGLTLADRLEQLRLVESHLNLARSLARRFCHYGDGEDLEQVAMMALMRAAGRYRPEKGFAFATYATASILGELKRHFRDRTWAMRVPRSVQETYLAVKNARDALGQQLGASPTVPQIATYLGVTDEAVLMAMEAGDNYTPISLDVPAKDGDGAGIEPPVEDPGLELALNRRQLERALPRLDPQEMLLVRRLYFDGWTQKQVAAEIGVSQMQVSRLVARALAKLRAEFQVVG
ncbi:MAG TPA: sigma-70 family RNA polymerase sigma factor [Acidimicrobiales bacterium]|nr:sigma-70 family RNA polymerase sigma factor [Acidimicrobiales bacterium]